MKKEAFEDRLGAVLGPSWVDLGTRLGQECVGFLRFFNSSVKIEFFEKVKCQEATWAELGPTWVPKRLQNGAREGAKTEQKRRRKMM